MYRVIYRAIAATLLLSASSYISFAELVEAKTVTLKIVFFGTRRNEIGQGQFSYDDAQPYHRVGNVDYFAIQDFQATINSQSWELGNLVLGSQPLLWAPQGERYPLPRIATIGGFGALTQGWAFFKPRISNADNYGVLLIKNPAYRNQGDYALTLGVQDVTQGGVFEIEEDANSVSPGPQTNPQVPQRSQIPSSLWQLGLVGLSVF